jgi:hypothetical protein
MTAARWIVGGIAGLVGALWALLFVFGDTFRRSFGASVNPVWKLLVPLAVIALLVGSTLAPTQRALLHVTLVVVVALGAGSVWLMRETPFVGTLGLAYCALWVWYYSMAIKALGSGAQH